MCKCEKFFNHGDTHFIPEVYSCRNSFFLVEQSTGSMGESEFSVLLQLPLCLAAVYS